MRLTPMPPEHQQFLDALPDGLVQAATRHGLTPASSLDADSWSKLVSALVKMAGGVSQGRDTLTAWLGDMLVYGGGKKYRGQIAEYARAAKLEPSTLRNAKLVCSRIPVSCRHDTLSWSHHCEVGKTFTQLKDIEYWLSLSVSKKFSTRELRKSIRRHLAGSLPPKPGGGAATAPFIILRELRPAGRLVKTYSGVWADWSPATCQLTLAELSPLADFIDGLRTRAGQNSGLRAAS